MDRITQKDLETLVAVINDLTGSPMTKLMRVGDKVAVCTGHFYLQYATGGGVELQRALSNLHRETISTGGYTMKKELYHWMSGFIAGIKL